MSELIDLKDKTLIDLLLEEQQSLGTPVGRFAEKAESRSNGVGFHRDLIPLTVPGAGEQYAFQVNLDSCSGCKGCVTACHSLNGLDEDETWRDVGVLFGESKAVVYQQTVTTACHHCVDPACLNGCPVDAYEKDPVSGIVLHLDDQCIGCQYCVLKCPYEVPKYNPKRGIVRKCDMCHSRLSAGEAPACVQACPHEAIKIITVNTQDVAALSKDPESFLPDSPDPSYTQPTTRYVSKKTLPKEMVAGDAHVHRTQHAHWPLVGLLTLSQIGIGGVLANSLLFSQMDPGLRFATFAVAWAILHAGLLCSVLHLGQPLKAWRIFLGFRHSWLSREAIAFGACSGVATGALGLLGLSWFGIDLPIVSVEDLLLPMLSFSSILGLVGLFTSVYIYVDTKRSFWKLRFTAGKFFGSVALGGIGFAFLWEGKLGALLPVVFSVVVVAKLILEFKAKEENSGTKGILGNPLAKIWKFRVGTGIALAVVVPLAALFLDSPYLGIVAIIGVAISETFERAIYFMAVNAPKMPGGLNG